MAVVVSGKRYSSRDCALDIVAHYVGYTAPDAGAAKALLGVNRTTYGVLRGGVAARAVEAEYRRVVPRILDLLETYGETRLEDIVQKSDIDVVGMLRVLKNVDAVYHKKKGERYKCKLAPLANGSLLQTRSLDIEDVGERNKCVTNSVVFVCCCIAYVHQRYYREVEPGKVAMLYWFMYPFYEYVLYLFQSVDCDLLDNTFFRMVMIMGFEKTREDRREGERSLGVARAYTLERIIQKTEFIMMGGEYGE